MENLNYLIATKYRAWSLGGQKIVWASYFKEKQGAIKLISSDITEIETQYNNLKDNGLLILQTDCSLIDIELILKSSVIDYIDKFENKLQLIIIK